MARLPTTGATVALPLKDEGQLRRVLCHLEAEHAFDAAAVHELYWKLAEIVGQWLSEQQRLDISPVGKALLSVAKSLGEISQFLGVLETGIHSDIETDSRTSATARTTRRALDWNGRRLTCLVSYRFPAR